MDEKPPLHIAFGMSAADSIRQALRQLGCDERVIGFPDDLSFGPIDDAGLRSRGGWVSDELGYDYDEVCRQADVFWAEATSPDVSVVAWVCRSHALEYAGYLELVWRMAERPLQLIDASDVTVGQWPVRKRGLWSLGVLNPTQIIEAGLFGSQKIVSNEDRQWLRDLWHDLKAENAPFRVVGATGLISAPIIHFDEPIMTCVTPEWRTGARIVGEAMVELLDRPFSQCPRDMVIWGRVLALAELGRVELEGTGPSMRDYRVRLAPAAP